ncbi:hypothetical protein G7Y79_00024g055050 [Physcia stellaris]|nr:hypothetical protein G7Y79_00024g055050 [Physcia stellaris]
MMTDPSTYSPSHRFEGCMCPMLFANQEKVASILAVGSLPLILLTNDPSTQWSTIAVEEAVQEQEFAAISHVWAEGSGNVSDNALHACLLQDISDLVAKSPWETERRHYPFWIDTLCVPVRPPELQILALNMMRVPYERAKHVLVLDSHLRSLNSTRLSSTEVFAQVSCSSWMRRLWTLQEGRLAKRVWFQFADKAVDVQTIFLAIDHRRIPSRIEHWIDGALYTKLWMQIWYRGHYINKTSAVTSMLSTTSLALSSRSVSVPTDEALCLVTLMGKDPRQVTAASPMQRMEVFWRTFDKVPKAFLFSKAPHKMTAKGLHWAPSSFMNFQSEKDWMGPKELSSPGEADVHAQPISRGLLLALPSFALHKDLIQRMKEFDFTWKFDLIIEDQAGMWYSLQLEQPWRHGSDLTNISLTTQRLAVLLAHELQGVNADNKYSHRKSDEIFFLQDSSVGVIVSISESEDDIMYAHAHNHVSIELLSEGLQAYFSSVKACAQAVEIPHATMLKESHDTLKTMYKIAAEKLLSNTITRHNLATKARHFGQEEDYESILDDFLDATVVAARFGGCAQVQKLKDSQLWCVD